MLHHETVAAPTLALLQDLQALPVLGEMRLVGGTALALQLGHRTSVDLDFCGPRLVGGVEELRLQLARLGDLSVTAESANVHVYAIRGVKVDLVTSPYPWLEPALEDSGVVLASPLDIAAMKLLAIVHRGARKDFIDLAELLGRYSLPEMMAAYQRKYTEPSLFALFKSLVYFEDAENEPMPVLLTSGTWPEAKSLVEAAVKACLPRTGG